MDRCSVCLRTFDGAAFKCSCGENCGMCSMCANLGPTDREWVNAAAQDNARMTYLIEHEQSTACLDKRVKMVNVDFRYVKDLRGYCDMRMRGAYESDRGIKEPT